MLFGRNIAGNGHLHAFGATENVRKFFQQADDLRKRRFRGALEFYQQHQTVFRALPHPASVGPEGADNRVYIHPQKAVFRLQVFYLVTYQKGAFVQEDIRLDGTTVLGIRLPERRCTVVVVMRMQDNGLLGRQGKGQQGCQGEEKLFHYL